MLGIGWVKNKLIKRKNNKFQLVKVFNPRGIVENRLLTVGTSCIGDLKTYQAWEIDYKQQVKDASNGVYYQFVSLLNKKPLKIYTSRDRTPGMATRQIAIQSFDEKLIQVQEDKQRQSMLLWLGILCLSLLLTIGLIVLLAN